ncbi:MAG: hypothetical protein RL693_2839 [Verrucomicrobiota bacterium]|jgi:hypothetical protein
MSQPAKSPYLSFAKGASAPCILFRLEDKSQLLLQYMHLSSMTLSPEQSLLCIHAGDEMQVQIEGAKLGPLFLTLQNFQISLIQAGSLDDIVIKRVVLIRESDIAP